MGYYSELWEESFFIPKENIEKAFLALKNSDLPEEWKEGENLEGIFKDAGFEFWYDLDGNIESLQSTESMIKLTSCFEQILEILVPFVASGSYLRFVGEGHEFWEWSFDEEKLHYRSGGVCFDGEASHLN